MNEFGYTEELPEDPENADFESLLRPYLNSLYRIAYRFTGSRADAEDLVQDLMIKLYPRRSELAGVARLYPWLVRVMYRLFVDNHRKEKRTPLRLLKTGREPEGVNPVDRVPDSGPDPEECARRNDLHEAIERALGKLSNDQRAVLTLHDIEGYPLNELERLLEIPMGTLKSRLHRSRAKLRKILKKNGTF